MPMFEITIRSPKFWTPKHLVAPSLCQDEGNNNIKTCDDLTFYLNSMTNKQINQYI